MTDRALRARFNALAIPPAWRDVWISPAENGHIQATGTDAAGRRQYIYHPAWVEKRDAVKFDRALALAEHLPAARGQVTRALREGGCTRTRALAAAFRMLDTGYLRIGSERYANANGSHGLSTLLCSHVSVEGDTVTLRFPAKSGQLWESEIVDPDLAAFVTEAMANGPDAPLLTFAEDGQQRSLTAADINAFVRERTGGEFTAKDFRTLRGTVAAAISLATAEPAKTQRARAHVVAQAMRDAAEVLENTPSIARKSYVDPRIVDRYYAGQTINPQRLASAERELRELLGK